MAWAVVAGAGISAGVSIYKGAKGAAQTKKAQELAANDPGYQTNRAVIDNARTVSDYYGNYQMPGYNQAVNNINSNFQNSFSAGVQGATSSNDVLDLATRMAYGKNQAFNQLGQQNAEGKQSALGMYLNSNAAAGQEYVNKNAYDNDRYQGQLREKAALEQAGALNTYGAIDQLAGTASKALFSKAGGGGAAAQSEDIYNKYYYPNGSPKFDMNGRPLEPVMDKTQAGSFNY